RHTRFSRDWSSDVCSSDLSIGAIGATGRGVCEAQGIDPHDIDILTGSLSKAIPSSGGFVAGSLGLKYYIQHGSAPYMFSAALTRSEERRVGKEGRSRWARE